MNTKTRSQSRFEKIVEKSKLNQPLGSNSVKPIHIVKLLMTQYNKKLLTPAELTFEINQLLRKTPRLLHSFRMEFYKNGLNIALKNNYIDNSPHYTIKPLQKTSNNRNTAYKKTHNKSKKISRKTY